MRRPALAALAAAIALAASCGRVPPRFADRPPVLATADDAPIPPPRPRTTGFSPDQISDAYLRHALVEALDPTRTPEAADINALDDVVRSTWFRPAPPPDPDPDRAPRPPIALDPAAAPAGWPPAPAGPAYGTIPVLDARGRRYLLRRDSPDNPQLRTTAEVIAGRLVRAIGYLTPDVDIVDLTPGHFTEPDRAREFLEAGPPPQAGVFRLSATAWPIGLDLGPMSDTSLRRDDPNDRLPHLDRRTLRALRLVVAWLRITNLDPAILRDVYVGRPPRGHVEHYLVGLHGALGADAVAGAPEARRVAHDRDGTLRRLVSLGLLPERTNAPAQTTWSSLGEIGRTVFVDDLDPSPKFAPFNRALPGDDYWIARRIAGIPHGVIAGAVAAGRLGDHAAVTYLGDVLEARRAQVVAYAFGRVTPCDVEGIEGSSLILRDLAVAHGLAAPATSRYLVEQLDPSGEPIAAPAWIRGATARVPVPLAPTALASAEYLVVRVRAERAGEPSPRALEVHLRRGDPGPAWRVRGVRH